MLTTSAPALAEAERMFSLSGGYRADDLNWNIAGSNGSPNILSELTWDDIEIYQVRAEWEGISGNGAYIHILAGYGWIQDGRTQDSDYLGNDRTGEFSRSYWDITGDDVLDFDLSIGKELVFGVSNAWRLIPVLGYSYHEQNLRVRNGIQIIPDLGPFPGLNTTYRANWSGPFLGMNLRYLLQSKGMLFTSLEWHWPNYDAKANWNLRDDFDHPTSFIHEAGGQGFVFSLGWRGARINNWSLGMTGHWQYWETGEGDDITFFSDGTAGITELNEVTWKSKAISLSINYDL